jgi:transcriptional regulator with XRE-family HTH domain
MMADTPDAPKKKRRKPRNIRIGERVAAARAARHLTMEALASQVGLSRQAIHQIERGGVSARRHTLLAIARALGVSLASLLGES